MTRDDIEAINTAVNKMPYLRELQDDWRPIDAWGGDCDSYAARKMLDLYNAGMPVTEMRFATCLTEHGDEHCVLLVEWEGATLVLDNRRPRATPYDLVPYKWLKLQLPGTPDFEFA